MQKAFTEGSVNAFYMVYIWVFILRLDPTFVWQVLR